MTGLTVRPATPDRSDDVDLSALAPPPDTSPTDTVTATAVTSASSIPINRMAGSMAGSTAGAGQDCRTLSGNLVFMYASTP